MRPFRKKGFPVSEVRRFLELGPIVLVSSAWKGETNIMFMTIFGSSISQRKHFKPETL